MNCSVSKLRVSLNRGYERHKKGMIFYRFFVYILKYVDFLCQTFNLRLPGFLIVLKVMGSHKVDRMLEETLPPGVRY